MHIQSFKYGGIYLGQFEINEEKLIKNIQDN